MRAGQRSLNLSNAVAVAVFEAWRTADTADKVLRWALFMQR
jgi:tRNA (cytidine/uridine-2'-O-)-methyltransferase